MGAAGPVTIIPPPVRELVERVQTTLEWERWYRERQHLDQPGVRAAKLRDIDGALAALEQLGELARRGRSVG